MSKIDIQRKNNESDLDYHTRLINGKLVDRTLAEIDYTELSKFVYGQEYSSDVARRMMYGSKRTLDIIKSEEKRNISNLDLLSEIDMKTIELRKERQKFYDQRNALSKIIRGRARQEEINEILTETIKNSNLPELNYTYNNIETSDNDLLVSLNDIHYGANYDNFWDTYNSDICRNMLKEYLDKIISIAKTHNSGNCICWENGDAISGSIHKTIQITNKENVLQQVTEVSELIAQFIAELSKHFKTVTFVSVSGNHSRLEKNKDDVIEEEKLDDLIEWYLKARLQNFENVIIGGGERIDPTMYVIDIRGKTYCGVHGDLDCSPTHVQNLQTMAKRPLYALLLGHLHHNKIDEVQGIKTIMAGSFLGMDPYCVKKRIFGKPQQLVCVCDKNGIVCHYDVLL